VHEFNEFFNMDTNRQKESITQLSKLNGIDYIFTAHYGLSTDYQVHSPGGRTTKIKQTGCLRLPVS